MSSEDPLVTIICPYFRRKRVVERTLRSISAQTFDDFEALIWDDASNDGTWEELLRVQALLNDARIKVQRYESNVGLTIGLNEAVGQSRGRYIAVVGSGDLCAPNRIATQFEILEKDPQAAFTASASITIDEITEEIFNDEQFNRETIGFSDMLKTVPFTHGSVMYRKSSLVAAGGYESTFTWCADWDLFLRLTYPDSYGIYCRELLYKRYATVDGVSYDPKKSVLQIASKYLVLKLAGLSSSERAEILRVARDDIDAAVADRKALVVRDLLKRQVKLALLGRSDKARELGILISEKYGSSSARDFLMFLARLLSAAPVSRDKLINFVRKFG